jgi:hypothetical protein
MARRLLLLSAVVLTALAPQLDAEPPAAPLPEQAAFRQPALPPPTPAAPDPSAPPQEMAAVPPAPPAPPPAAVDPFGIGGGLLGFGGRGALLPGASYQATWLPVEPVSGQPAHLGFVRQDFSLTEPVWSDADGLLVARARVRSELFQTNAILPDTPQPFPSQLWNVGAGLDGLYRLGNGWVVGGGGSFGSASDRPFANAHTLNGDVNAFLRLPSTGANFWQFSLAYSPLAQIPFPVPGVAYVVNTERYSANIGLPLRVVYRGCTGWVFDFSYMLLTNVHAHAIYQLTDAVWLHAGYDWTNEGYFLAEAVPPSSTLSADNTQRFFYYEQRLTAGVRFLAAPRINVDLSAGYAFDRDYQRGSGLGGGSGQDRLDVGPGAFLSAQVWLRW